MYQIFQSSLASHLSDGGSLGAGKVHHEQHSRPHLLRHIHHPTTLLHRHLREGDVVCVCVHGVFSCFYHLRFLKCVMQLLSQWHTQCNTR